MSKRILTGLKPTGEQLHIGNYFGAVKPFLDMTKKHPDAEVFLFLASMHAYTTLHDGPTIKQNNINILKLYIACGADPQRFFMYDPREIPAHAQLNRVFMCLTNMGYMHRMHSFKDAVAKGKENELSVGTFGYPILQAADILLYDADIVPVGKDQQQHVEFARDIANKFNHQFGETFVVPNFAIKEDVAVVPGIDGRKMSKSYNNFIGLLDDEKTLNKKVKQISTATLAVDDPKDPDECNVYNILKLFLDEQEDAALRDKYQAGGLSYKYAKEYLYEKLIAFLTPLQTKYKEISDSDVIDLLTRNVGRANAIASTKINEVYEKIGFTL